MALILKNRVKSTTTTTGTGTITLGSAATGYQSFSVIGDGNETYYVIKGTTQWEVGKGTYTSSGTTLSRTQVFGSSASGTLVDFASGTKDVLCAYPSTATPGGVPSGDNSSVGTDLSGWQAFFTALNNGVVGGQTFGNNNTNGVVSTFSLVYTAATAYSGGVLAANGDIHFVPNSATVGQKISVAGVVSTYSLIGNFQYGGGVLASNGDIHFVPIGANRGQKISPSGVVSSYSLVYTSAGAYFGGVLAPNGDIHFIPLSANRGQKVSAAGVVSTYSLVFTTTNAYQGGVLAPNGDIHFVPRTASVGQKISAAGVVSTYSLVYTLGSGAYAGGVLAPNGDIHFIRGANGRFGQKISISGVVSTYSLVYSGNAYNGGVLAANGDIYFIPSAAVIGQKISTNPGSPLGPGICLSPFLNKY